MLSIKQLSKTYANGVKAINNVSLDTVSYTHLTLPTILLV